MSGSLIMRLLLKKAKMMGGRGGALRRERGSRRHCVGGATDLTLDLFASPAGCFDGTRLEVAVGPCLLDHCSNPVLTEGLDQLTVGVRVREIADNAHGRPHQSFTAVHVVGDDIQELEDRGNVLLEYLSCRFSVSAMPLRAKRKDAHSWNRSS